MVPSSVDCVQKTRFCSLSVTALKQDLTRSSLQFGVPPRLMGYPERALRRSKDLMTLAQAKGHYPSIAGAWHFAAFVHQARGEAQQCQDCAESGIALSSQQGFTLFSAFSTIDQGWAMAQQFGNTSGIEIMRN